MAVKVAINGFGRIGRLAFRQMFGAEGYEVVAINDLTSPKMLAHLLKYDSTQGTYALADKVEAGEDSITVDGKEIKIYAKANAAELPWGEIGVDVVLECTGFYTSKAKAQAHIDAGAKKAAAEKKADEPQKAAFEKAVEKEVKEEVKKEAKLVEVQPQTIKAVEDFLKNTMKAMDMEVELKTEIDQDGALCVDMSGEHMGILIGKRGQTLDSLQYLANRVANKHQEGYVRVKLDTENYRARREETLRHLAKNIAHKVKRNRRPVALEPMNPYERRIIHSALQSDPYVMTHSEGEEPFRKVVITLKK